MADRPPGAVSLPEIRLLGVRLHAARVDQLVAAMVDDRTGGQVQTLNLDHLRRCHADPEFRALTERADVVVADGMPIVWASRLQGTPLPERVTGSDLLAAACAAAAVARWQVLLIGGEADTAARTAERLRERHPDLRIATEAPAPGFENDPQAWDQLVDRVRRVDPDLVFVGLGSPKQEQVIARLRGLRPGAWWIGVGYVFSFASGAAPRAGRVVQRLGLEWLHRLLHEPRRLARRYLWLGLPFAARMFGRALLRRCASHEAAPELLDTMGPLRELALAFRRPMHALAAGLLLLLATPLLVACAVAVRLHDGGPAFFVQSRAGLAGRPFRMLKLRTMRPGSDEHKPALLEHNEMSGPVFKMSGDPRVTPIGRLLRRFSLDELPQLVNVVRGDMALVGPRPALLDEVARYEEWQRRRLTIKPGLTGLWQVSGRNEIDFHEWVLLDLDYLERWSLARDLLILMRTLPAVLSGRGAR